MDFASFWRIAPGKALLRPLASPFFGFSGNTGMSCAAARPRDAIVVPGRVCAGLRQYRTSLIDNLS